MSIIRTKSPHRFTIVSNELLVESNPLSWEATGLLVYLLSKPDNWKISIAALTKIGKCGKNKIESILRELKQLGYIVGKRHFTGKYDYYVYDTPQSPSYLPQPENQVEAKKPKPENPVQAFPVQDFQALINTDKKTNTKNNNNDSARENNQAIPVHAVLSLSLKKFEESTEPKTPIGEEKAERQKEEVIALSPLAGLSEKQIKTASKKIAALAPDQAQLVVLLFNKMAESGRIKENANGLLESFISQGRNNELEPPRASFNANPNVTTTQARKTSVAANTGDSRKETLMGILKVKVEKCKAEMLEEYARIRAVHLRGIGVFYESELRAAGLFD